MLGRLVLIAPAQSELLERIMTDERITLDELEHANVLPPPTSSTKLLKLHSDTLFDL